MFDSLWFDVSPTLHFFALSSEAKLALNLANEDEASKEKTIISSCFVSAFNACDRSLIDYLFLFSRHVLKTRRQGLYLNFHVPSASSRKDLELGWKLHCCYGSLSPKESRSHLQRVVDLHS